jgi:hypothetical protein
MFIVQVRTPDLRSSGARHFCQRQSRSGGVSLLWSEDEYWVIGSINISSLRDEETCKKNLAQKQEVVGR